MNTQLTSLQQIDRLKMGQIIFDHSEWVTIWGAVETEGCFRPMNIVISFDMLNRLLRFSGKKGDDVQMKLVERLEQGTEEPSIVDLEKIFGGPVELAQCRLMAYHPRQQLRDGSVQEDLSSLFVENVQPLLEQKRLLRRPRNQARQELDECLQMLAQAYELYRGYLELDIDEEEALQKAGLEEELTYKMAYCAWEKLSAA